MVRRVPHRLGSHTARFVDIKNTARSISRRRRESDRRVTEAWFSANGFVRVNDPEGVVGRTVLDALRRVVQENLHHCSVSVDAEVVRDVAVRFVFRWSNWFVLLVEFYPRALQFRRQLGECASPVQRSGADDGCRCNQQRTVRELRGRNPWIGEDVRHAVLREAEQTWVVWRAAEDVRFQKRLLVRLGELNVLTVHDARKQQHQKGHQELRG